MDDHRGDQSAAHQRQRILTRSSHRPDKTGPVNENGWANARLRASVSRKPLEEVVGLLEAGADPNFGSRWSSPLARAAQSDRGDVVDVLVAYGADPAWDNTRGWSAATFADEAEHHQLADHLVALGAPASSRTAHDYSDLHRAARRGDLVETARLTRSAVDPIDAWGDSPLVTAIAHRHEAVASVLLRAGAGPGLDQHRPGRNGPCALGPG